MKSGILKKAAAAALLSVTLAAGASSLIDSPDFMPGVWGVDSRYQNGEHWVGKWEFLANGRFDGWDIFAGGGAPREVHVSGRWKLEKLTDQTFRLTGYPDSGTPWWGDFKIIDRRHIENIQRTYLVERLAD
jgi:hypothetical protein